MQITPSCFIPSKIFLESNFCWDGLNASNALMFSVEVHEVTARKTIFRGEHENLGLTHQPEPLLYTLAMARSFMTSARWVVLPAPSPVPVGRS